MRRGQCHCFWRALRVVVSFLLWVLWAAPITAPCCRVDGVDSDVKCRQFGRHFRAGTSLVTTFWKALIVTVFRCGRGVFTGQRVVDMVTEAMIWHHFEGHNSQVSSFLTVLLES